MLEKLSDDLKTAMKAREQLKVSTLRLLLAEVKNLQIKKGGIDTELEESDFLSIFQKGVKQRAEAAKAFRDGGRNEMADKEEAEAEIIRTYMPEKIDRKELEAIVDAAISETEATSKREMGKVMKSIMSRYQGRVEGREVQNLVLSKLP